MQSEGKCDRAQLFSEDVMVEHKQRLVQAKKDVRAQVEVLLSLRVNALQISPELRKNLVYELIRNDLFFMNARGGFLMDMLDQARGVPQLCHALLSIVSVIVSTLKGVEYIVMNGHQVI